MLVFLCALTPYSIPEIYHRAVTFVLNLQPHEQELFAMMYVAQ